MKLNSVKYILIVQDMNRAVNFYKDVLGFDESFVSDDWSELNFGDTILALHGGGSGKRSKTGLSLQYDDVEEAYNSAINNGGLGIDPPEYREGEPIKLSILVDTEGNEIMLTQYVGD